MAKKNIITLVAIILFIAGALVALHLVNNLEEDILEVPEPVERHFVLGGDGGDSPHILTVDIYNEHGRFTVINEASDEQRPSFTVEGFEDYSLQTTRLASIANSARNLAATQLLFEGDADLNALGLDEPLATVNIHYLDGTTAVLLIGNSAPGGAGAYAMREGGANVYLIPRSTAEHFLQRVLDLVDHTITALPEGIPSISKAVLAGSVRPEPIVIESDPPTEGGPIQFHTHLIVSPVQNRLHPSRGIEPLMDAFDLRAERIEARFASTDELNLWGLDEPYSTLAIESDTDDNFKLMVSAPDRYGMVYLIRDNLPFVYQVNSELLPWLELTFFDMMERLLIIPFIDDIARLEIYTPGRTVNITLEGEGNELAVFLDGAPYEAVEGVDPVSNFRTLYQYFLLTSYEAIPEEPMPPNTPIIIQFTYHYRDGRPSDTVTIYEGAARRVFIQLNDETPMLGLVTLVDYLLRSVESFLAGEMVDGF